MRFRKVMVAVAVAAIASFGVAVAAPAQAKPSADWEIAIDCTGPVVLPGAPGDVYMFYLTGDCLTDYVELWNIEVGNHALGFLGPNIGGTFDDFWECDYYCPPEYDPSDWYVQNNGSYAETFAELISTNDDGGSLTPGAVVATFSDFTTDQRWYITWGQAPGAGPTEYWTQGVGRASADATCDAGWAPSWDFWPNGGTGGWVCVREVPKYS